MHSRFCIYVLVLALFFQLSACGSERTSTPPTSTPAPTVIANIGAAPQNLGGWRLNAGDNGQDFTFPSFDLAPGQSCRVYTNEVHPESCGFSFGSGRAIWNNQGDCGYLFDAGGAQVSNYCY